MLVWLLLFAALLGFRSEETGAWGVGKSALIASVAAVIEPVSAQRSDAGAVQARSSAADNVPAAILGDCGASMFGCDPYDLQTEPQPEPLNAGTVAGRKYRELSDDSGSSCRTAGRHGPNSGALLALLARAAARARHDAARWGARA
jgi:hypothetical protein